MSNHRDTSRQLRDMLVFSGSDSFMQNGHQIINSNLANARAKRKNSDWAKDDEAVRQLLFKVFPKLETDEKQRLRAGYWMRVIQLFHRSGMSYGDVAAEMGVKYKKVMNILHRINRARRNVPLDGVKRKT